MCLARPRRLFGNPNSPGMSAEVDKSFGIRTYPPSAGARFRIHSYKLIELEVPWNQGFMAVWRCGSALATGYGHNSFRIRTRTPATGACKPFGIRTYEISRPEVLWIPHLRKKGGGGGGWRYRPGGCLTDWTGSKPDTVSQWQARVILRSPSRIPKPRDGTGINGDATLSRRRLRGPGPGRGPRESQWSSAR